MELKKGQISVVGQAVKKGHLDIRTLEAAITVLDNEYKFTVTSHTKRDLDRANFTIGKGSVIFYEGNTFVCTGYETIGNLSKYPMITALLAKAA